LLEVQNRSNVKFLFQMRDANVIEMQCKVN
jgi:hypothetical protein